jgi:transcriptional regulator with XRE-family HTH domain
MSTTMLIFDGAELRHARNRVGLTQATTARLADCHPATLMRIERSGYSRGDGPQAVIVARLCEVLGVDPALVFYEIARD